MKIKYLVLIISFLGFCGCKRGEIETCNNEFICQDFDFSPLSFETPGVQYKYPSVNPNNSNEFVFASQNFDTQTLDIYKYDLLTQTKTLLVENKRMVYNAKWNVTGDIAFADISYHIWIIKADGTGLHQLTESAYNLFPAWDNTGDNIYYYYSPVLGIPYYLLKRNISTEQVDTVYKAYAQFNDISKDNKLLSSSSDPYNLKISIGVSDIPEIDFDPIVYDYQNTFEFLSCSGLAWGNGNTAYMSFFTEGDDFRHGGIYEINVMTKQYHKITSNCGNLRYENISCTADGKWLMAERIESKPKQNANGQLISTLIEQSKICRINLETFEETIIDIN